MNNAYLPLLLIAGSLSAHAQWSLLDSHTDANLRGIVNVGKGIVWASGTKGTVIHSVDDGATWRMCAAVPVADKLDFRGIQAWDAKTAIVMSVGTGDDSRIYRTTDSCRTWKLIFTNPDKKGFWDCLYRYNKKQVYLFGDPVDGKFSLFHSEDSGKTWSKSNDAGLETDPGGGAFAASNTSFTSGGTSMYFGGKGVPSARIYYSDRNCGEHSKKPSCSGVWRSVDTPMATGTSASGVFSIAAKKTGREVSSRITVLVAVGGVHNKPAETAGTALYSLDGGKTWATPSVPPHGYRSCVAYAAAGKVWIAVGPNGTDISSDDGKTWRALGTDAAVSENWSALSLPFAAGPKGRIGKLKREMLKD